MTITSEKNLRNFEFWAGAKDRVKYLTFLVITLLMK